MGDSHNKVYYKLNGLLYNCYILNLLIDIDNPLNA